MKSATSVISAFLSAAFLLVACVPAESEDNSIGTGGRTGSGGAAVGSGGAQSAGTGGAVSTGGVTGSGGARSGGATGTGGRGTGGAAFGTGGGLGTGGGVGAGGSKGGNGGAAMMAAGGGTGTFMQVAALLQTSCGTGMCHQGGAHHDLRNNTGLYARLVSAMPVGTNVMAACKARTLIVPKDPTTSVISQVIKASAAGCTNARMPDNCGTAARPCLTPAQIALIDGWITAGAPM